ncbi:MAG TPA: hypothetical protein VK824_06060 [Planctomycetota bacterium]|nr:hypothetical protein [Planctomycetota bacterium]
MSMRSLVVRAGSVILLTLGLSLRAQAGVVVVDPGGGSGSAALQAALTAAADGDVVLVRAGSYLLPADQRFVVAGKGLTLATDAVAPPMLPGLEVSGVPSGSSFFVRGFTLGPVTWKAENAIVSVPTVLAHDNSGAVWIEDCAITGRLGSFLVLFGFQTLVDGSPAVSLADCAGVTLQRCSLTGGKGIYSSNQVGFDTFSTSGGAGLTVNGSSASLHDCTLLGGAQGDGFYNEFLPNGGGAGAVVQLESTVLFAGCSVTGGPNGVQPDFADGTVESPGNGLTVSSDTTAVLTRDSAFAGGTLMPPGIPGVPISAPAGSVVTLAAPARSFTVTSPLKEGAAGALTVNGEPGDLAMLLVSAGAGWSEIPSRQGVLVLATDPLLLFTLGATDGRGNFSLGFTMPSLPAGTLGATIPMQLLVSSAGDGTLEAASALTWLDSSL